MAGHIDIIERGKTSINLLDVVKANCIICIGGDPKDCTSGVSIDEGGCLFYDFRFGKNPRKKKAVLSEERKQELRDHMSKIRKTIENKIVESTEA